MEKLPIGIQDFASLREEGYVYVDKTQAIHTLLQAGKALFFSRPRRFGKSLLISTLHALFDGRKDLFAGLWIEDNHDFKPRPVIRIDFSAINSATRPLEGAIVDNLRRTARGYGITLQSDYAADALSELIIELAQSEKVVVLIDEYDKPITDYLEDQDTSKRNEHQRILRSLYGQLKPLNGYLHLLLLTGVSKIGKLSLFSDLNNLQDISLVPETALLLGYTQAEIQAAYPQRLQQAWTRLGLTPEQFWDILRYWYNGYSWDGVNRLYCPFSLLLFLANPQFKGYWYETGTPSWLIRLIKNQKINPLEFERIFGNNDLLSTFNIDHFDATSIMFQTGYLTIQQVKNHLDGIEYTLSYPNQEVRQAFSRQLLEQYSGLVPSAFYSFVVDLSQALKNHNWPLFFKSLTKAYASIPYLITPEAEKHFHAIFHMLMCATGLPVQSEVLSNKGRMDTVVDTRAHIVIFELKIKGDAQSALKQINTKDYNQQFSRPTWKIGVVFDLEAKNLKEWQVEAP
jgi:hypothetical protein